MASASEPPPIQLPKETFALVSRVPRYQIELLLVLGVLESVRLWLLPMGSSFWLDELITFWSAYKGVVPAIARSQFWPGQAMPYTLLSALVIRLGGTSEIALRLPSLLATVLTAWLLFRLGEHFFDRETGVLVVVVFASFHEIAKQAAMNARPYGIALLLVVASVLQLVRWLDQRRLRNMVGFVLTAAAIPYFQFLFATIYLVFLAYAVYIWRSDRRLRLKELIAPAALIAILLSPLVWNSIYVHRTSSESSWASSPDALELVSSFMPQVLAASILLGVLAGCFARGRMATIAAKMPRSAIFLFVSWFTIPIVTLFIVARISPFKVFVSRYYLPSFAALALIVGSGIRTFAVPRMRLIIATSIALVSITSYSGYHLFVSPHREDWRAAAKSVRAADLSSTTPVLIRVGIVESAKARWDLNNINTDSPLLCPLSKYPMPGRIVPLPYSFNSQSSRYLEEISSQILKPADRFVMVSRNDDENFDAWMRGWFASEGFESTQLETSKGVSVFLFLRHNPVSAENVLRRSAF